MKAMRGMAMAVVVTMLFAAGATKSQEKPDDSKKAAPAEMQPPKPGPEMEKLNFLIGNWTMDAEYVKSPMMPEGGKQKGWYKAVAGPGGFSVIADFELDASFWNEIGHEVITWSPTKNAYVTVTVGNGFPDAVMGTAHWEGPNLVAESSFEHDGKVSHMKAVYSDITNTSAHLEEFAQKKDGTWLLIWKADVKK